jgi:hypothetical protein
MSDKKDPNNLKMNTPSGYLSKDINKEIQSQTMHEFSPDLKQVNYKENYATPPTSTKNAPLTFDTNTLENN